MNLVFIYLGEECLVIIYSASELAVGIIDVILQPDKDKRTQLIYLKKEIDNKQNFYFIFTGTTQRGDIGAERS